MFPVKKSRLYLQNPVTSLEDNCNSSICAICKLIGAVTGERAFSTADHIWAFKEEQWYGGRYWDVANDAKLWEISSNQGAFEKRLSLCVKHTGSWLSVWGTTVTCTVLAAI